LQHTIQKVYVFAPEQTFGTEADMKSRYLIAVGVVLLAVVGMTIAQPKPQQAPQPSAPLIPPTAVPVPSRQDPLVVPAPRQRVVESKPEDMTIEQLIDAVDGFREQKAEIEKKERAYLKVLHRKADKLKERIDSLDGGTPPTLAPPNLVPSTYAPSSGNPTRWHSSAVRQSGR
jgi:hypothetical protein